MSDAPKIEQGRSALLATIAALEDENRQLNERLRASRGLEAQALAAFNEASRRAKQLEDENAQLKARPVVELPAVDGFVLLSTKHSPWDGACVWWGPHRCGYTSNLEHAGVYSADDAQAIAERLGSDVVVVVRLSTARAHALKSVPFEAYLDWDLDEDEREPS